MTTLRHTALQHGTLLVLGLVIVLAGLSRIGPVADEDVWWHVTAGHQVLQQRSWHLVETASFLKPGQIWSNSQWLGDLTIAAFHGLWGFGGVSLYSAATYGLAAVCLWLWVRRLSVDPWPGLAVVALALGAATVSFAPRPQALGMVWLTAALLYLELEPSSVDRGVVRWLVGLGGIQILFSHTHDSHVLLAACVWIRAIGALLHRELPRFRLRVVAAAQTSLLATLAGPLGVEIVPRLMRHHGTTATRHILEWQPMTAHELMPWPVDGSTCQFLLLLGSAAAVMRIRGARWEELGYFVVGLLLSLKAQRFMGTWAVLSVPLAARGISRMVPVRLHQITGSAAVLVALSGIWGAAATRGPWPTVGVSTAKLPVFAMDFLVLQGARGHLFNHYNDGGYVQFRSGPELKITIDGRTPAFFDDRDFTEWANAISDPRAFDQFADRYDVEHLLVPRGLALCPYMRDMGAFRPVYMDRGWTVFTRTAGGFLAGDTLETLDPCDAKTVSKTCREDPDAGARVLADADLLAQHAPRAPFPWIIRMEAGMYCRGSMSPDELVAAARQVLRLGAITPRDIGSVAQVLARANDFEAALAALDMGMKHADSDFLVGVRGIVLRNAGRLRASLGAFEDLEERVRHLDPVMQLEYAKTLRDLGRHDDAASRALMAARDGHPGATRMLQELEPKLTNREAHAQDAASPVPR